MQGNTRPNCYATQHDLERLFDGLKDALLRHQPTSPIDFLIGCLNAVQQKKRESKESLQYSNWFNEYAAQLPLSVNQPGPAGGPRKRPRPDQDQIMHNRTPPYTETSTPLISQSLGDSQRQHSFGNAPSPPSQNFSPRFHNNHQAICRRGRRLSVSAESIRPSEQCHQNFPRYIKDPAKKKQIEEAIQNNLLFRDLEKEVKERLLDAMFERTVEKGETIIRQGDEGDNFYVVLHGLFDILVDNHKVLTVADGGSFGELALMYNAPRAATVIALTDATLWAVDRKTFLGTIANHTYRKRKTYEDFLRSVPIFQNLRTAEITKLADALEPFNFQDGEQIVTQNDPGDYFYIIEKGNVRVLKRDENNVLQHMPGLTIGRYFGELALINDEPRKATVIADGPVSVVALKRDAFHRLLGPIEPLMDILRRNAENYEMLGVEAASPQQQPSPGSPVYEYITQISSSVDRMAVDEPAVITIVEPPKKSSYSGPGGVQVVSSP